MGRKPETLLVRKIMDRLEVEGGWWFKVHGSVFQASGVPDIIGCWNGLFVAIEVKCEGNSPTLLQKLMIDLIRKAGGRTGVAYTVQEALLIRNGGSLDV